VLARLTRVAVAVVLLAAWQAALEHPIEHLSHEHSAQCDVLDALTACATCAPTLTAAAHPGFHEIFHPTGAPRLADAPPFFAQGPPSASV
jgi:hypothetical protein